MAITLRYSYIYANPVIHAYQYWDKVFKQMWQPCLKFYLLWPVKFRNWLWQPCPLFMSTRQDWSSIGQKNWKVASGQSFTNRFPTKRFDFLKMEKQDWLSPQISTGSIRSVTCKLDPPKLFQIFIPRIFTPIFFPTKRWFLSKGF